MSNGDPTIGIITSVNGSPALVRNNQSYILDARSRIYAGDILQTDAVSRARISMTDGSVITLGTGSHLIFHEYQGEPDIPPLLSARMTLTSGSILASVNVPAEAPQPRFEIRTPLATLVLGAGEYWGGFGFENPNTFDATVIHGQALIVSNDHGTVELNAPGLGTTIIGGTGPQPLQSWSERKLQQALSATILDLESR